MKKSKQVHVDATYKLNFQGFPVFLCGVSSENGKFFGSLTVLSSHEDSEAWTEVYSFMHDSGAHYQYFMADGAKAITVAQEKVFSGCSDCNPGKRLMCYPHVHRNLRNKIGTIQDKATRDSVMKDIEEIQWSAVSEDVFLKLFQLLRLKYENAETKVQLFLDYVEDTWINSKENLWFEGARPYGISNNQGLEGKNKHIKDSYSMRRKLPLGTFIETSKKLVNEMSISDASLLNMEKSQTLYGQPDSLKLRTNGYNWYQEHQSNNNYLKTKPVGKTQVEGCEMLWLVPSSKTAEDLQEIAAVRLSERFEISSKSLEDYIKIRSSCYIIEQKGLEFFCDCFVGSKGHMCKHAVGLMFKLGLLEITGDVRSKPLGQKRKRGRPAELRHCLAKTPPRVPESGQNDISTAQYH